MGHVEGDEHVLHVQQLLVAGFVGCVELQDLGRDEHGQHVLWLQAVDVAGRGVVRVGHVEGDEHDLYVRRLPGVGFAGCVEVQHVGRDEHGQPVPGLQVVDVAGRDGLRVEHVEGDGHVLHVLRLPVVGGAGFVRF